MFPILKMRRGCSSVESIDIISVFIVHAECPIHSVIWCSECKELWYHVSCVSVPKKAIDWTKVLCGSVVSVCRFLFYFCG